MGKTISMSEKNMTLVQTLLSCWKWDLYIGERVCSSFYILFSGAKCFYELVCPSLRYAGVGNLFFGFLQETYADSMPSSDNKVLLLICKTSLS